MLYVIAFLIGLAFIGEIRYLVLSILAIGLELLGYALKGCWWCVRKMCYLAWIPIRVVGRGLGFVLRLVGWDGTYDGLETTLALKATS